jgi:hypothetical protein
VIDADDDKLRAAYRAGGGGNAPDTAHPTPEALAAAAEGRDSEDVRLLTLGHVATCAQCRSDFDLLWATDRAGRQLMAGRRRAWTVAAATIAVIAAAVVLVVLPGSHHVPSVGGGVAPDTAGSLERGAAGATPTITLIAPLVWHAVPGATRYDVEILDDGGSPVFHSITADTTVAMPALDAGRHYRWWVRTSVTGTSWRSPFGEFTTPASQR